MAHRRTLPRESRNAAVRRREFDAVVHLVRLFRGLGVPWQVGNAGFEPRVPFRVAGFTGTVVYKVHAIGFGERRLRFKVSVTLWPRDAVRGGSARTRKRSARLVQTGLEACGRALRRHGYRGDWPASPWGRFGDFWKSLRDVKAVRSEVRVLERWVEAPPWAAVPSSGHAKPARRGVS